LFSIAALCAIVTLSYLERFLVRFGERRVMLTLLGADALALLVLSWHGATPEIFSIIAITAFIGHYAIAIFILRAVFDIYFEEKSSDTETGIFRGELLTAANVAWVLSPVVVSQLLFGNDFWKIYSIAFFVVMVLFALLYTRMPRRGVVVKPVFFVETLKHAWHKKPIFYITMGNFLMHFFFSWMVIYLPIYLLETLGFTWENVGLILAVMLLPYVLIDIPLGFLVDKYGERVFLFFGFLIMAVFTVPIGVISTGGFLFWSAILFTTRIGAAIVELTTDTYFFRHVGATDGNMIGFYRYAQPLAYVAGPLLASLLLFLNVTTQQLFLILSAIILFGTVLPFVLPNGVKHSH
jgi:MFS family permease